MSSGTHALEQDGVLDDVWRVCGDGRVTMCSSRWEDGQHVVVVVADPCY
jgi:hypothetical protein